MTSQFSYGGFTLPVINVHFVVLTSGGNEGVVGAAAEAAVDDAVALLDPSVPADEALVFDAPKVKSLE